MGLAESEAKIYGADWHVTSHNALPTKFSNTHTSKETVVFCKMENSYTIKGFLRTTQFASITL